MKRETEKSVLFRETEERGADLKVVPKEAKKDKSAPVIEGLPSPHRPFQGDKVNKMFEQRERQQKFTKQPSGVDDSEWEELAQSAKQLQKSGMATGAGSISSPPSTPKVISSERGGGKEHF